MDSEELGIKEEKVDIEDSFQPSSYEPLPIENYVKVEESERIDTDPFEVCEPSFIEYETTQEEINPGKKKLEIKEEYIETESELMLPLSPDLVKTEYSIKEEENKNDFYDYGEDDLNSYFEEGLNKLLCMFCNDTFKTKKSLKTHIETVHEGCKICKKTFKHKKTLKTH